MRRLLVALLLLAGPSLAAPDPLDWDQHPGAQMPLDTGFHDANGAAVALSAIVHGTPTILDIGYFRCTSLCGIARADLFNGLAAAVLTPGRDVQIVSMSMDPHETPADAADARQRDAAAFPGQDLAAVRYLTGGKEAIALVSGAAGFRARWDELGSQWYHPTGLVILDGAGRISSYLLGVGYSAGDLRTALIRARSGGIARAALPVLLLCFHYDPATGRYDLVIIKLLRLLGVLTVLTLIGLFVVLQRHRRAGA